MREVCIAYFKLLKCEPCECETSFGERGWLSYSAGWSYTFSIILMKKLSPDWWWMIRKSFARFRFVIKRYGAIFGKFFPEMGIITKASCFGLTIVIRFESIDEYCDDTFFNCKIPKDLSVLLITRTLLTDEHMVCCCQVLEYQNSFTDMSVSIDCA